MSTCAKYIQFSSLGHFYPVLLLLWQHFSLIKWTFIYGTMAASRTLEITINLVLDEDCQRASTTNLLIEKRTKRLNQYYRFVC